MRYRLIKTTTTDKNPKLLSDRYYLFFFTPAYDPFGSRTFFVCLGPFFSKSQNRANTGLLKIRAKQKSNDRGKGTKTEGFFFAFSDSLY